MEILLLRIIGLVFLLLSLFLLIGLFIYLYQELYYRIVGTNSSNSVVSRNRTSDNWNSRHRRYRNRVNNGRQNRQNINRPVDIVFVDPLYPRDPVNRDDPGYGTDN